MKNHTIGYAAAIMLAMGCATPDSDIDEAKSFAAGEETTNGVCMVEQCFDITAEKDISFIAVQTEHCPGTIVSLHLTEPDGTLVNVDPMPHGQGKSCDGIAPEALKFEGLNLDHYVLCVGYEGSGSLGDIEITTKAGKVCEVLNHEGDCSACPDEGDDCDGEECPHDDCDDEDCPDDCDGKDCPEGEGGAGGGDEGHGGHGGDCP